MKVFLHSVKCQECSDGVLILEITKDRYSHISVYRTITIQYDEDS
ncbi:DUF6897 domain-containing protein [Methanolobus vulcani]